jgi:hypothetical protein
MIASRLRYCNDRGIFGLVAIAKSLFQGKIIDREIENRERQRLREELLKSNVAVVQSFSETLRSGNYNQYAIDLEKQRALTLTEEGIKAINAQKEQMETIKQKIVNGKNKAIGYIRALIGDGKLKLEENKSKKAKEKGPVIPLVQAEPVL